ncbi:MAG TPA: hypothetical protein VGQ99_09645 [Tepidisphaeraceae bacterium]|jgi:hypothetical protein|nr:hypothetical protein [Tepidisphaeraceae bacterium]
MTESNHRPRTPPVLTALLTFIFLLVLFLRHDYWQWDTPGYLLFGFLPVGLWWQAGVTLLATLMMALMVHLAWPSHLEDQAATDHPR